MHNTIIFDFDGTLIDSALGILATYSAVLGNAGITPAVALDARLVGPPLQATMSRLVGAIEPQRLDELVEDFKLRYADIGIASTPAYAAAESTLKQLIASGKTLYLATNKRAEPTLALLEKFAWGPYFRRVYCIDSHQPPFADKSAMLRQLLTENNLNAADCLYVGDTRGDYLSANACGIKFIGARWGYEDWQSHADQATMLAQAYDSLTEMGLALQSA